MDQTTFCCCCCWWCCCCCCFLAIPVVFLCLLMQSPIAISVFLASCSLPLSGRLLFCQFLSPILSTWPAYINLLITNFFLKLSFIPTPTLSSSNLLSSTLLTHTILLTGLFSQTWTFCYVSVSAIVSSPFMYAGVTHELSPILLNLRDKSLFTITPSTFLQAFAPAVALIIIKTSCIVGFDWVIKMSWVNL